MPSPESTEAREQPVANPLFNQIDELAQLIGHVDPSGKWVTEPLASSPSGGGKIQEISVSDVYNAVQKFQKEKLLAQVDIKYEEIVAAAINTHTVEENQLYIDQGYILRDQLMNSLEQITLRKTLWQYEELHLKGYVEALWKYRQHVSAYPEETKSLRQRKEIHDWETQVSTAIDQLKVIIPILRAAARLAWTLELLDSNEDGKITLSAGQLQELTGVVPYLRAQLNHRNSPWLKGLSLSEKSSSSEIRTARDNLMGKMREVLQEVVPLDGRSTKVQLPHALYVTLIAQQRDASFQELRKTDHPSAAKVKEFVDLNLKLNAESKNYHIRTLKNAADAVSLLALRERFGPDVIGDMNRNLKKSNDLVEFYKSYLLPEKLSGAMKGTELNQWTDGLKAYTSIVSDDLTAYGGLVDGLDAMFKRFEGLEDFSNVLSIAGAKCAYWVPEHTLGYARFVGLDYAKLIGESQSMENMRQVEALRQSEVEAEAVRTILSRREPELKAAKAESDGALAAIATLQTDFPPEKCFPPLPFKGVPYEQIREKYLNAILSLRQAHEKYLRQVDGLYDELQANLNMHATRMTEHELLNENNAPSAWKGGALSVAIILSLYQAGKSGGVKSIPYAGWPLRPFRNVPLLRTMMKPYYFAANVGNALTRPVTGTYDTVARMRGWSQLPRIAEEITATQKLLRIREKELVVARKEIARLQPSAAVFAPTSDLEVARMQLKAAEKGVEFLKERVAMLEAAAVQSEQAFVAPQVAEAVNPATPPDAVTVSGTPKSTQGEPRGIRGNILANDTEWENGLRSRTGELQNRRIDLERRLAGEYPAPIPDGKSSRTLSLESQQFLREQIDLVDEEMRQLEVMRTPVSGFENRLSIIDQEAEALVREFSELDSLPRAADTAGTEGAESAVTREAKRTQLDVRARALRQQSSVLERQLPLNTRFQLRQTAERLFPGTVTDECWAAVERIHAISDDAAKVAEYARLARAKVLSPEQMNVVKTMMRIGGAGGGIPEVAPAAVSTGRTVVSAERALEAAKASKYVTAGLISAQLLADAYMIYQNRQLIADADARGEGGLANTYRARERSLITGAGLSAGLGGTMFVESLASFATPLGIAVAVGSVGSEQLTQEAVDQNATEPEKLRRWFSSQLFGRLVDSPENRKWFLRWPSWAAGMKIGDPSNVGGRALQRSNVAEEFLYRHADVSRSQHPDEDLQTRSLSAKRALTFLGHETNEHAAGQVSYDLTEKGPVGMVNALSSSQSVASMYALRDKLRHAGKPLLVEFPVGGSRTEKLDLSTLPSDIPTGRDPESMRIVSTINALLFTFKRYQLWRLRTEYLTSGECGRIAGDNRSWEVAKERILPSFYSMLAPAIAFADDAINRSWSVWGYQPAIARYELRLYIQKMEQSFLPTMLDPEQSVEDLTRAMNRYRDLLLSVDPRKLFEQAKTSSDMTDPDFNPMVKFMNDLSMVTIGTTPSTDMQQEAFIAAKRSMELRIGGIPLEHCVTALIDR